MGQIQAVRRPGWRVPAPSVNGRSTAVLNERLLDAQVIESQLWVDVLEVLAQRAEQEGAITDRLDSKAVAQLLACVVYGAMAMKSGDANFNVRAINGVARALLTGNIVEK